MRTHRSEIRTLYVQDTYTVIQICTTSPLKLGHLANQDTFQVPQGSVGHREIWKRVSFIQRDFFTRRSTVLPKIDMGRGRGDLLLLLTVSIGRYGRGCPLFRETFLPDVLLD